MSAKASVETEPAPGGRGILDWTEKHRPAALAELVGNGPAIKELKDWAETWRDGVPAERAVVLAGEPGVGKTSAAHALARDMGWGVIELNASDQRNEEVIRRIAGSGAKNRAFTAEGVFSVEKGGRQLVILDEADNLFGREDRGGLKAIIDTIREARQPIVLIANDLYELQRRGAALKTLARTIKFTKVRSNSIPPALRRIAKKEGLELEEGVPEALAERASGDMRSAVNDLQAIAAGRSVVALDDVKALGKRDTTGNIFEMLKTVFFGKDADAARKASWDLDETPDNLALWIDENLPLIYTDRADLVDGFNALSKASVFLGRVQRRQQFGLWSYATEMMTAGVCVAKHEKPQFQFPRFPLYLRRLSTSKGIRELRDRTAGKVGSVCHTSRSRARQDIFPYLRTLMGDDEPFAAWAAWRFELEADELAFLLEEKPTAPMIKKIIELGAKTHGVPVRIVTGGFGRYDAGPSSLDEDEEKEDAASAPQPAAPAKKILSADEDDEEAPTAAKKAAKPAAKAPKTPPKAAPSEPATEPTPARPEDAPPKRQRSLTDF